MRRLIQISMVSLFICILLVISSHDTCFAQRRRPRISRPQRQSRQAPTRQRTPPKEASVLATLDCPLPSRANVIWCATFQMAWDTLINDTIGEPINIPRAQALVSRLNQAEVSPSILESESFFVCSGWVKQGIVERIQQEMATRFPSESIPQFDSRYRTLPDVTVSYAYLNVAIDFKYPFYTNHQPFMFRDTRGNETNVRSFCAQTQDNDPEKRLIREQVRVLYGKFSMLQKNSEFAVDICQHTHPYQVTLACTKRGGTLRETVVAVEQKITEYQKLPDYHTSLCKLKRQDKLIAPDITFNLTHHFEELLNKPFANQGHQNRFIFDAIQTINFTLSRTGVKLKSEARIGTSSGRVFKPRHFYFNRPFLIYIKKRGQDTTPFFVMWVDNIEFMEVF